MQSRAGLRARVSWGRRRFQFSLVSLLATVVVCAVVFAGVGWLGVEVSAVVGLGIVMGVALAGMIYGVITALAAVGDFFYPKL